MDAIVAKLKLLERRVQDVRDLGHDGSVIGVFGAFDTWPYIDYVSQYIASKGNIALTSIYWYYPISKKGKTKSLAQWARASIQSLESKLIPMRDDLLSLTEVVDKAVVIFSVSAAHYIETEWLYQRCQRPQIGRFEVLGICFGRPLPSQPGKEQTEEEAKARRKNRNCSGLRLLRSRSKPSTFIAVCQPEDRRTGWQCADERRFCPFMRQDISKNVLEYFFSPRMRLVALEHVKDIPQVLNALLISSK